MNLHNLGLIQAAHKQELEQRLQNARDNLRNLDRMAQECFSNIEKRAEDDKQAFAKIFTTLTANEETTITLLQEELATEVEPVNLSSYQMSEDHLLNEELGNFGTDEQTGSVSKSKRSKRRSN